jgi:hypothetical protein
MKRFRVKVKRRPSLSRARRTQPVKVLPRAKRPLRLIVLLVILAMGCTPSEKLHPTDMLYFPIGVAADPAGDFLYVNSSNFDLAYDYGTVVALDLSTHRLVAESAVQVPSFGGELVLRDNGDLGAQMYLPTRDGNTVVWIDIERDNESSAPRLACNDDESVTEEAATICAGSHVLVLADPVDAAAACGSAWDTSLDSENPQGLDNASAAVNCEGGGPGEEPFGAAVSARPGEVPHLYVGSFGGDLSVFRLSETGAPFFSKEVDVVVGTYDVAVHPQVEQVYATTKFANVVQNILIGDDSGASAVDVSVESSIVVSNDTIGIDFGRGIAFNATGTRAFVAYRTPPTLVIVDTEIDADGKPVNRILAAVPVGSDPAIVAVAPSGPGGSERVYVSAFLADQVWVVDPRLAVVVDVIDVGDGPYDMAVAKNGDRFRLYVSLFEENAIGVIELDIKKAFYHQEVARVP